MRPRVAVPATLSPRAARLRDRLASFVELVDDLGDSADREDTADGVLDEALGDDGRLAQLFTSARLRRGLAGATSPGALVAVHSAHKYLYLAHDPSAYRTLGRLVAAAGGGAPLAEVAARYRAGARAALAAPATPGKHANVLEHILGFFKRELAPADKRALLALIEAYRRGAVALAVPRERLHALAAADPTRWIARQVYFEPYPRALYFASGAAACA